MSQMPLISQTCAAFWEIDNRLLHHSKVGGILQGLHYDKEGTLKIDGEDTLPLLQPWGMQSSEDYAPGAPRPSSSERCRQNSPITDRVIAVYRFSSSRKYGFFRRAPADNNESQKGFMEWVASIKDACETAEDGSPDASLKMNAWRPIRFSVGNSTASQLCFTAYIEITIDIPPMFRAERRLAAIREH
jgi:hypothetical protein